MSVGSPETAVLVARVRDDVARQSAELAARIPAHVVATTSIRVDEALFVAAGTTADNRSGALTNPVVGVADAAVVPDVAVMEQIPVPHVGLHAEVYRRGGLVREVITVECGVEPATAHGLANALAEAMIATDVVIATDVRGAPITTADPVGAVAERAGLVASAPLAVLPIPGFGVVVSATALEPTVLAAATALRHFSSARAG